MKRRSQVLWQTVAQPKSNSAIACVQNLLVAKGQSNTDPTIVLREWGGNTEESVSLRNLPIPINPTRFQISSFRVIRNQWFQITANQIKQKEKKNIRRQKPDYYKHSGI